VPRFTLRAAGLVTLAVAASACGSRPAKPFNAPTGSTREDAAPPPSDLQFSQQARTAPGGPDQAGLATYYSDKLAGHKTSSGERYDPRAMTAAHRKLPNNTWVEVRRVDTGTTVRVRINDHGPNTGDETRIIDLSRAAAERLGMIADGVVRVEIRVVRGPE
jgi:rare lipoprotein A